MLIAKNYIPEISSESVQKKLKSQPSVEESEAATTLTRSTDAEIMSEETTKQPDLIDTKVEICQKKLQSGTVDSPPEAKRYLTRQSIRMSLSANKTVSLSDQTTIDNSPNIRYYVKETDKTYHNQESALLVENSSELMEKLQTLVVLRLTLGDTAREALQQFRNRYKIYHFILENGCSAITRNCKNIDELIEITDEITRPNIRYCVEEIDKTYHNQESTLLVKNSSKLMRKVQTLVVLRSALHDNFREALQQLREEFQKYHFMYKIVCSAVMRSCKTMDKLIEVTDEITSSPDNSELGVTVKKLENRFMVLNINEANVNMVTGSELQNNAHNKEGKKHNSNNTEANNNNPINKIRGKARKFTLPPEYDPNDSRWTLKHRKKKIGLVELVPRTRIYVDADQLSRCKIMSKDSKTLARMLLLEIFTENALNICSLTGKKANAFDVEGTGVRPGLNLRAIAALLKYVEKHALEKNWVQYDPQMITNTLRNKIQEIRGKFE